MADVRAVDGTFTSYPFIEDGDTLTLTGAAHGEGYQVGFGSCVGKIKPAIAFG